MGQPHQISCKKTDVISASEIGQYHFCSVAWYLKKCGYDPQSPSLARGAQKHEALGAIVDHVEQSTKISNVVAIIGYLLLAIAILILILGAMAY
ncbi:MAG: hypothetical protein JW771_06060 [Candidatus Thermoplasmatota archaeon]|nr:hypothetical protein [Candidatus Thermoplasmatota archaeon]